MQMHLGRVAAIDFALRRRFWLCAVALGLAVTGALSAEPVRAQALPDFTELVERVGPAVVNIRTTEKARPGRGGVNPEMDEDMLEFFRRFGIPIPNRPNPNPRGQQPQPDAEPQTRGVGSGFILSADGYVMTNAHVVDGADEVIVTLTDKRELKARIIGVDKRSDVALVKIDGTALPFVRVGDINRLKVGEWVLAIGSPFGLDNSVTAGIVSAKSRDTGDLVPLIQTDVAINPGNSGGPLINMRGEVIGINSQIYSRSGGYMGISFAIPIDEAIRVSDQLRASGRVIRGRIGVAIADVDAKVAESIGLGKATGALVRSVESGGPAEKAGVEPGDIITKVEGKAIDKPGDLQRSIAGVKPGTKATLQVFRRGGYRDLTVSVVEFEADRNTRTGERDNSNPKTPPATTVSGLGLTVADLTDAQKRELKVKNGVRVESVEGATARAGLREGDVLLSIENSEVTSAKQFEAMVGKLDKAKPVTALVRRGDTVNFVIIRPAR
jgi:serine protease Do